MSRQKKIISNIRLLSLSVLIFSLVLETILRLIIGTSLLAHNKIDSDFIQYDKAVKYLYKKNFTTNINNENYNINVFINSFGYRDKEWSFEENIENILVVGNSYTAGLGVNVNKRWSDLLNLSMNKNYLGNHYKIYNAAVSGYGLEQMRITIEQLIPLIKPKKVIVGLNTGGLNRLIDPYIYFQGFSLKSSKLPYAKIYDNELYIHHFKNSLLQNIEYVLLKYSVLYNYTISKLILLKNELMENKKSNNELTLRAQEIIFDLKSKLKDKNIDLILLPVIQHNEEKNFSSSMIEVYNGIKLFCEKNRIEVVDILPVFKEKLKRGSNLWIKKDPHWNEFAHELTAKALLQILLKKSSAKEY